MFKPIRKKINEIDRSAVETLLQSNRRSIIAMNGDDGYPYLIEDGPESIGRLKEFAMKYYPDESLADEQIARNGRATQMFEIIIEHMSGK